MRVASALGLAGALVGPAPAPAQEARSFTAEGTDTVYGLGARHLAMGGTGTATADDTYALYYNPANLAGIDRPLATAGRQLNATLRPYSFVGLAVPLGFARDLGLDATMALGRYPRVHAHSTGAYAADDFESIFLHYLLPNLGEDFDGEIDSKTLVNRLALGFTPLALPGVSLGLNLDVIDCRTNTCGVRTDTVYSVHATAVSHGVSASWRPSDRLTLGAMVADVSPGLNITSVVTDATGSTVEHWQSQLPMRMAIEGAWRLRDDLLLAFGAQRLSGHYGDYDMRIDTLHFGAEWQSGGAWVLRAGAWAPVTVQSSRLDAPPLPIPAVPTIGAGWHRGPISADLAVFAHPADSLSEDRPVLAEEFTLTWRF